MVDFTIRGELASRLQAAAEQNQMTVEQLISDLLEMVADLAVNVSHRGSGVAFGF